MRKSNTRIALLSLAMLLVLLGQTLTPVITAHACGDNGNCDNAPGHNKDTVVVVVVASNPPTEAPADGPAAEQPASAPADGPAAEQPASAPVPVTITTNTNGAGNHGKALTEIGTVSVILPNGKLKNGNGFGFVGKTLLTNGATLESNVLTAQSQSGATIVLVLVDPLIEQTAQTPVLESVASLGNETAPKSGNQPQLAGCSALNGTTVAPPETPITAQQIHDMFTWGWKPGPTGGRNHIRALNACVKAGNSTNWNPYRIEPANSNDDIAGWKKMEWAANMYNTGTLVFVQ